MTGYWNNWQVLSVVWCEIIGKTDNSWFAEQKLRDSTQMQPVNKLCTVINWSSPPMQRTYRFSCTYTQHSHTINCNKNLIQQQQNNICFIILSFGQPTWAKKITENIYSQYHIVLPNAPDETSCHVFKISLICFNYLILSCFRSTTRIYTQTRSPCTSSLTHCHPSPTHDHTIVTYYTATLLVLVSVSLLLTWWPAYQSILQHCILTVY